VDAWFEKARGELAAAISIVRLAGQGEACPTIGFFVLEFEEMVESLGRYSLPIGTGT
jgi:hypothetical protein